MTRYKFRLPGDSASWSCRLGAASIMVRVSRLCARLPQVRIQPDKQAHRDVSPDVLDAYLHRIEAYATMIVVGSLMFGFAATTAIPPAQEGSQLDSLRQNVESCLLMATLASSAFTVVVSSTLVYHSLKLAATVGLAAFSHPEGARSAAFLVRLRESFDRYIKRSGYLRGWARFALALAFLLYLTAVGIDRASAVTPGAAIAICITLVGGTLATIFGVRSLSFDYRLSSIALKVAADEFEKGGALADAGGSRGKPDAATPAADAVVDVSAGPPLPGSPH